MGEGPEIAVGMAAQVALAVGCNSGVGAVSRRANHRRQQGAHILNASPQSELVAISIPADPIGLRDSIDRPISGVCETLRRSPSGEMAIQYEVLRPEVNGEHERGYHDCSSHSPDGSNSFHERAVNRASEPRNSTFGLIV
jgi:hypothetical protein